MSILTRPRPVAETATEREFQSSWSYTSYPYVIVKDDADWVLLNEAIDAFTADGGEIIWRDRIEGDIKIIAGIRVRYMAGTSTKALFDAFDRYDITTFSPAPEWDD